MSCSIGEVIKRDGRVEKVSFDKITKRVTQICSLFGIPIDNLDLFSIIKDVIKKMTPRMHTRDIDELLIEEFTSRSIMDLVYYNIASKLLVSNLHKNTSSLSLVGLMKLMNSQNIIRDDILNIATNYEDELNQFIHYDRDYSLTYIGIRVLEKSYLLRDRNTNQICERPQHLWIRVAIALFSNKFHDNPLYYLQKIKEVYDMLSKMEIIHATPTLFNAGTRINQYASCFLLGISDSIEGMYKCIYDCAMISKSAGGVGIHIANIRPKGSIIKSTNLKSDGIIPFLRVLNEEARHVNQGMKRRGSFAIYLEPWHHEIMDFLELRRNQGIEHERCRDLFLALMIPNEFMKRVIENEDWFLLKTGNFTYLNNYYGEDFTNEYIACVNSYPEQFTRIPAREIWNKIISFQIETGAIYIIYKDAVNFKSNQKHLGTIKSSNLCAEINLYSDEKEYAVCNLASVCVHKYIIDRKIDYNLLKKNIRQIVYNLNQVINITSYPTPECSISNLKHRPLGIGINGLADTFLKLDIPFISEKAKSFTKEFIEHMYYYALEASCDFVEEFGVYKTFKDSPLSKGYFQFDLWNEYVDTSSITKKYMKPFYEPFDETKSSLPWDDLRKRIISSGITNSVVLAFMPTATTAQILGNSESFEPHHSFIYNKKLLSGEFMYVNTHLYDLLKKKNLWNRDIIEQIIRDDSVKNIKELCDYDKEVYKNVFEIRMRDYIDMNSSYSPFICQAMSMNLFISKPDYNKISSMLIYAWKKGLKTGIYYLRTHPASEPTKFTFENCIACAI